MATQDEVFITFDFRIVQTHSTNCIFKTMSKFIFI